MILSIPEPAIKRLSIIYQYLCRLSNESVTYVSSRELGNYLEISAHTVRKDISYLKKTFISGSKYRVEALKEIIGETLFFSRERNACIVGLGRIGSAILHYNGFKENGFNIKAGFDSNINRIETIHANCPLFPTYQIQEKVKELDIELAVLAVPGEVAQASADKLIEGGVLGIVNFTSNTIRSKSHIHIIDIDVTREFRILSAMISLDNKKEAQ